jgi:hypothetical protein
MLEVKENGEEKTTGKFVTLRGGGERISKASECKNEAD